MRKLHVIAILTVATLVLGGIAAWSATASFRPPLEQGTIFAVINADRSPGAVTTRISVKWGSFQRTVNRGNPYGTCSGTTAGWVLMINNTKPDASLFTLDTSGRIVRPPYQGMAPPEVGHPCYKLERMRVVYYQ